MKKEIRELLDQLEKKKAEVRSLLSEDKVEDAEKLMDEVRELQKKIEIQKALDEDEARNLDNGVAINQGDVAQTREDSELEKEYRQIFLKGLRRQKISSEERSIIAEYEKRALMHEGGVSGQTGGDSSLIIPQDIQTRINEVRRQFIDLSQYVTVESVTALSGSRVIEVDAEYTPFPVVEEYGELQEVDNPKFRHITYRVKKRGGILPLTNELLADTDQNLMNYVSNWIGKKAVATENFLILGKLNEMTKQGLANFDDIRRVLNVALDPAIALTSVFLTNQDGFHYLDGLKDGNGRYLLEEDITQPGRKQIKGRQVIVVPNHILPTDTANNKVPVIVGDLKQLLVLFRRRFYELASTNVGGDAWRRDTTELRAIMRHDITFWDNDAAVFGQIDLTPVK